ncbi:uncharacterized protein LOC130821664 [Amaranthus tricolor]|uniref:uncharacterized protein LOC130821664 n=1 Tax=Amaranthus tricolor TaxID=29722 RepID=UPI00258ACA86|nr:uncharacterized protein LOC130821664 [Amaranthus tricolor]
MGHRVVPPCGQFDIVSNLRVTELIDFNNAMWDADALAQYFDTNTAVAILTMPLSSQWPTDKLYWFLNKSGVFSMKSGYWLALLGHNTEADSFESVEIEKLWRLVWNVLDLPKLCQFLWRLCKGSLASKAVLYNRYCVLSSTCDRCGNDNETVFHSLYDCPKAMIIWEKHAAHSLLVDAPRESFPEFFSWIHGHTTNEEFASICATLWAAWFYRHKQVFEGDDGDPVKLATNFNRLVTKYNVFSSKIFRAKDDEDSD